MELIRVFQSASQARAGAYARELAAEGESPAVIAETRGAGKRRVTTYAVELRGEWCERCDSAGELYHGSEDTAHAVACPACDGRGWRTDRTRERARGAR